MTEYKNDDLAKRARFRGLDEYEILERAAIFEYDAGFSRSQAEEMALAGGERKSKNERLFTCDV